MTSVSDQLPPLREVIKKHDLMAKKSLGQNFLLDLNLTAKIARQAGHLTHMNVIEVGPGPGGLTRALVDSNARHVFAIEKDDRCIAALSPLVAISNGKLTLVHDDALRINYAELCDAPRALIANLPYNIATTLLMGWMNHLHLFESLTLMFQKEVADRITANVRTKAYGRLSVMAQWLCDVEKKFDLPPSAFTPPPKVTSSVVHFIPKKNRTDLVKIDIMERVTAAAFGQRRKMLRQSLKSLGLSDTEGFLKSVHIPDTARAEEIDASGFVAMAKKLQEGCF